MGERNARIILGSETVTTTVLSYKLPQGNTFRCETCKVWKYIKSKSAQNHTKWSTTMETVTFEASIFQCSH